ncbi:L-aspartate oxidase [Thermotalea metallivorans]|uniref:L-aspartate oxidase n=1 Tax=Thermotalea metallivorans TaxID=520762 RepID=A0A140KZG3_9FIRM|nr:L-aspartate oxidase [Thermotalea metallivorans]KXG73688.1 L-aspartate oxidase [Thermotalea metallivorans]
MDERYISQFDTKHIGKIIDSDVIVIGTGIAGLYTALNIDEKYKVLLMSKAALDTNNSNLAQGGIAACVGPEDDFEAHYEDTLRAGAYYNHRENTRILIEEAPMHIEKLLKFGVHLDRDEHGKLLATREGGHSKRRVLHAKDATGKEIIRGLGEAVRKRNNIRVEENIFVIDILTEENKVLGVLAVKKWGEKAVYKGRAVVLATGGIGQIYKNTTNPLVATGDGIAMAYRGGVKVKDMEFIQFHPTAMYTDKPGQKFLISEAVRGEGAILRNVYREAFMEKYHPLKDLAPRDIVSRSIFTEMIRTEKPYVYLDITHKSAEFIRHRFPTIYERCLAEGIDMTKEWIPVAPAEHYVMGGIETDASGRTNIRGLYACGECACTGVHGANRLASNSLLEGLVFGGRVAEDIHGHMENAKPESLLISHIKKAGGNKNTIIDLEEIKGRLKNTMDQHVSIIRSEEGLKKAWREIEDIKAMLRMQEEESIPYYELLNMTTVALLIIEGALKRKDSLGGHYRLEKMEG